MNIIKNIVLWNSVPKNNKCKELQIYFSVNVSLELTFKVNFTPKWGNIFNIDIDMFDLISLHSRMDKETDHAGFRFFLNVLGLHIEFSNYDTRHWDDENETWCVYDDDDISFTADM